MTVTVTCQNVAGSASNIGFFFFGGGPNPLLVVETGWYANGTGVVNGKVTNIVINTNPDSSVITIEPSQNFQSGEFYNFTSPYPCFKENTKILCLKNGIETDVPIQNIQRGDYVKTLLNGYVPVSMIGKGNIYNSGDKQRITERLYRCSKEFYRELTEDLIITGTHSILVDTLTEVQKEKTIELLEQLYITEGKYLLMAVIDERTIPYNIEGSFDIYHIALENDDYYMNYGIYANGLLVETCSKRYLKELSNMTLY